MIRFRQKEYSSTLSKAVYGFNTAKDKVQQGIQKTSLNFRRAITRPNSREALNVEMVGKLANKPLSKISLARKSVAQSNAIKHSLSIKGIKENTKKTLNTLNHVVGSPGEVANRGIQFVAKHPIAATGEILDNAVTIGVPLITRSPKAIAAATIAPVRVAAYGAEAAARKSPLYRKVVDNIGTAYENSRFSKGLSRITGQDVQNIIRTVPIGVI